MYHCPTHCERSHSGRCHFPPTFEVGTSPAISTDDGVRVSSLPGDEYVVGIDYGTLSGRAVVVRVSDGAELGSATHDYSHAVMDTTLASTGATLPPEWALQVPPTTSMC